MNNGELSNAGKIQGGGAKGFTIRTPLLSNGDTGIIDGRMTESFTFEPGDLYNTGQIYGLSIADTYNNIVTDGRTATSLILTVNGSNWITDIYTTSTAGKNAFNSFKQFNAVNGNMVNLILPSTADNLINFVSGGRSEINGMVKSLKGGAIGGHVYFLNPSGMLVGASGTIQTGALTVHTAPRQVEFGYFLAKDTPFAALATDWTLGGLMGSSGNGSIEVKGAITTTGVQEYGAASTTLSGKLATGGGDFVARSKNDITVNSGAIISTRKVADGVELANHADSAVLSIGNSGKLKLTVDHETHEGKAKIELSGGAKLVSFASNGAGTSHKGGDISAVASSQTRLFAWAMTGPDAEVKVGDALLKGENVTLQAIADNNATKNPTYQSLEDDTENTANLDKLKESSNDLITTIGNLRVGVVVSNVHAKAKVTLEDKAKLQADKNVNVSSEANSAVNSILLSVVGGAGVALSEATADTIVKTGAEITAGNTVDIKSATKNTINMSTMPIPVAAGMVPLNIMVTYAGMNSNATSGVEAGANINAGGAVNVKAGSIKDLTASASASASGGYFSAGLAISKSDVNANANVAGTIKAGGDLSVDAKIDTLQNKTWSASSVGDGEPGSGLDLAVDWIANGIVPKIKQKLDFKPGETKIPPSVGITGAVALTFSKNTATANITSKDGNYVQTQGKIDVASEVKDLLKSGAIAQQKQREENNVMNNPTPANKKAAGVSAAVLYSEYDNTSTAYIGDDAVVDAKKKLSVNSAIKIPLPNNWADKSKIMENVQNAFMSDTLGIGNAMFSSWAQSSSDAGKGSGSASVNITKLTNDSEAYIGKRAKINQNTTFNNDQSQNDVSVTALTDVTTLTMAGMFKSPLDDLIKAGRDKTDPMLSMFGSTSGGSGVGGSVLVTFEESELVQQAEHRVFRWGLYPT